MFDGHIKFSKCRTWNVPISKVLNELDDDEIQPEKTKRSPDFSSNADKCFPLKSFFADNFLTNLVIYQQKKYYHNFSVISINDPWLFVYFHFHPNTESQIAM